MEHSHSVCDIQVTLAGYLSLSSVEMLPLLLASGTLVVPAFSLA
jgi:hypothetical protein